MTQWLYHTRIWEFVLHIRLMQKDCVNAHENLNGPERKYKSDSGNRAVSNPFSNWSIADAELHNARVTGNRTQVAVVGTSPKLERDLHAQIFDECRRRGWIAFHGSMSERTHRTAGEPDFIIVRDGGCVLFVECKTRLGKLSTEQQAMIAHAAKLGHTIHVVRSMEEFLKLL